MPSLLLPCTMVGLLRLLWEGALSSSPLLAGKGEAELLFELFKSASYAVRSGGASPAGTARGAAC